MKFLFLNSSTTWGGTEKWACLAANALSDRHDVWFGFAADAVGDSLRVSKQRMVFQSRFDLRTVRQIVRLVREHHIDVLIPTKQTEYFLAGAAAKLCGAANILRLGIVRDLRNAIHNNVIYNKLADGIIVNAGEIKEVLLRSRYMQSKRIRVIYNGLDTDRLNEVLGSTRRVAKPFPFTIATMGRLTSVKRVDVLLKAFARFLRESGAKDAGLQVIGEGPELDSLQRLAGTLCIADKVIFTGFLPNPYPCLIGSDIFVLSSRNEGISNAMLEAMYLGSAVVATSAGGVTGIFGDGEAAVIIDVDDRVTLAERLVLLYENADLRERIALSGRAKVAEQFSLDRMCEQIVSFSDEVLRRK